MVSSIIVAVFRARNNFSDMQQCYSFPFLRSIFVSKEKHEHLETRKASYGAPRRRRDPGVREETRNQDRKSTRLNSSHVEISYAVFCLKKKKKTPEKNNKRSISMNTTSRLRR